MIITLIIRVKYSFVDSESLLNRLVPSTVPFPR